MDAATARRWAALAAGVVAFVAGILAVVTGDEVPAVVAGSAALLAAVAVAWAGLDLPVPDHAGMAQPESSAGRDPGRSSGHDGTGTRDADPPAVEPLPRTPERARPPVAIDLSDAAVPPPEPAPTPDPVDAGDAPAGSDDAAAVEPDVDADLDETVGGPGPALLPQRYIEENLRGRVAVARRALRPVSVLYIEVVEVHPSGQTLPVARSAVADAIRVTLREADAAGDAGDDGFICVLEDTGEDGAVWTAERLRRCLASDGSGRRFRAGVASYPTHGLEPTELQAKARAALLAARDWSRDRIEVAPSA